MKTKEAIFVIFSIMLLLIILVPFISADFSEFFGKITGKATSNPVTISTVVGSGNPPTIPFVYNSTEMTDVSSSGTNEGPAATYVTLNFTAYDAQGFGNLNDTSAVVNYTKGATTRENSSCEWVVDYDTNYANYTCKVTMWWWDATGTWDIQVYISDLNNNNGTNTSQTFQLGTTAGAGFSPSSLSWTGLTAGATNQEPNENFLLNNTGNLARYIELNATDLEGESNPAEYLYANNFTAKNAAGCEGTAMVADTYTNITGLNLPTGNYTLNDETAQEEVYICLEQIGADLDAQTFSTTANGAWTIRITSP